MSFPPIHRLFLACGFWLHAWAATNVARADAEVPVSNDYVLRVWETDDGLPQNNVTSIAQTPDGYLWVATQGGLVRFDGVRFTPIQKDATPELESSYARALATDRTGALWIGLERGGVARRQGGRFESVLPVAPPSADTRFASSFAVDAEGAVWIGMAPDQCVYRWRDSQLTKLTTDDGVGPGQDTLVHADSTGRIWFASKLSCGVFDGSRFRPVDPEGGERVRLTSAREGGMWATRGKSLLRYSADGVRQEIADLGWLGGAIEINALLEDRAGDLWLGTRGAGLLRFRAGKFARVPTSHQAVLAIFEGGDGSLWAGTMGGLNRLRSQRFFLRGPQHGIEKEGVSSLCEETDGHLWLAVRDSAPVRSVDAANQSFVAPEGWTGGSVTAICSDPTDGIWLGYDGGRLQHWRDGAYTWAGSGLRAGSLFCDRKGNVWRGTMREGLVRFSDGVDYPEPTNGGLILVRALAEDAAGCVWAGTEDGLVFRREGERFVPVALPGARSGESIRFLVPDGDIMWICARDAGLYRWQGGRIGRLQDNCGIATNDFRALVVEPDGGFWLATGRGLFRTTRSDIEDVLAGRQCRLRGINYGRDDGLPKVGFAFGRRNAAIRTRDGRLWFATDRGALEVNPEPMPEGGPLPPLLLEEVRVDGLPIPLAGGAPIILPPKPGPLEICYTVPQLSAPERLRFRYRLTGLETGWTSAENARMATYARLPPGRYRFEVAVSEGEGAEVPASTATLAFIVNAAWWETAAFRIATAVLSALALAAVVRMLVLRRVRTRIRRLEQEQALHKERVRIARDMHDDLGASLTQITLASRLARLDPPEEASGHIDEIAAIAQRTVAALDEIVWAVNPRNDMLPAMVDYLSQHAVDFLSAAGIACEVEIPHDLPAFPLQAHVRHHLFLVVKETLNNVVKHARAATVQLTVEVEPRSLKITVADDGCGFVPGRERAGSDGLLNMRARMAEMDGDCQIECHPGAGTRVIFKLPLPALQA